MGEEGEEGEKEGRKRERWDGGRGRGGGMRREG